MNNKIYIRDGRRFKQIPNMVGLYWNDIILTKEKMDDSIALCVSQDYEKITLCILDPINPTNWDKAKEKCEKLGARLPSRMELLNLKNNEELLKIIRTKCRNFCFWTNEECNSYRAWYLDLYLNDYFGRCGNTNKGNYYSVLAFVDIPLNRII